MTQCNISLCFDSFDAAHRRSKATIQTRVDMCQVVVFIGARSVLIEGPIPGGRVVPGLMLHPRRPSTKSAARGPPPGVHTLAPHRDDIEAIDRDGHQARRSARQHQLQGRPEAFCRSSAGSRNHGRAPDRIYTAAAEQSSGFAFQPSRHSSWIDKQVLFISLGATRQYSAHRSCRTMQSHFRCDAMLT